MNIVDLNELNQFLQAEINDSVLQLNVISNEIDDHEKNREIIMTAIRTSAAQTRALTRKRDSINESINLKRTLHNRITQRLATKNDYSRNINQYLNSVSEKKNAQPSNSTITTNLNKVLCDDYNANPNKVNNNIDKNVNLTPAKDLSNANMLPPPIPTVSGPSNKQNFTPLSFASSTPLPNHIPKATGSINPKITLLSHASTLNANTKLVDNNISHESNLNKTTPTHNHADMPRRIFNFKAQQSNILSPLSGFDQSVNSTCTNSSNISSNMSTSFASTSISTHKSDYSVDYSYVFEIPETP